MSKKQQGSILLNISIAVFIIAALTAGFTAWRLRHISSLQLPDYITTQIDRFRPQSSPETEPAQAEQASAEDPLMPALSINPMLYTHKASFEKHLISPLRLYYATQPQHLQSITINPSADKDFLARVNLMLITDNSQDNIEFLYAELKDGSPDFLPWEPSMFDNEPQEDHDNPIFDNPL